MSFGAGVSLLIMLVVIGHLVVAAEDREAHLALSRNAVKAARKAPGCHPFAATADPLEPTWVAVAEVWSTRDDVNAYRNGDAGDSKEDTDPFRYIREFHIEEYETT